MTRTTFSVAVNDEPTLADRHDWKRVAAAMASVLESIDLYEAARARPALNPRELLAAREGIFAARRAFARVLAEVMARRPPSAPQ